MAAATTGNTTWQRVRLQVAALLLTAVLLLLVPAQARAGLPTGNAVTDSGALLRNALPMEQKELRAVQHVLESSSDDLRAKRWSPLQKKARRAQRLLAGGSGAIAAAASAKDVTIDNQLDRIADGIGVMEAAAGQQDRDAFLAARREALGAVGEIEAAFVDGFPFAIPEEFAALPRLLGRAQVKLHTTRGDLVTEVDGYNAPLTAGAYVDLVRRGFYDGLGFNRAEAFYVLQTGDPDGAAEGFVDPGTRQLRTVPLEIRVPQEPQPFYNLTFEDLGLYKAEPVLPFSARGTLGWAHSNTALDDGSSQFFFFLSEPELTPAGLNLIDGRFAAFGYVVEGMDVLDMLTADDRILEASVISGEQYFRQHG